MEYNANLPTPKFVAVDRTADVHTINGQNYLTITAAEGRKLMQRITKPTSGKIDRVLAQGKGEPEGDEETDDEFPEFILVEAKTRRSGHMKGVVCNYLGTIREISKLELQRLSFYQAVFAEFIGTFLLTLFVCGIGIKLDQNSMVPGLVGALGGGLTVSTMIWVTNSMSGGNINPAITLTLVLSNELNILRGVCYIVFQLLGSIAGFATLLAILPSNYVGLGQVGLTLVNPKVSLLTAVGVEFIITFMLTLTALSCIDKKRKDLGGSYPLSIGLSVTVGAVFGGAFTGGSMNPARSFGPAVVQNVWTHHWVYWVGPITGALFAAILYKVIFIPKTAKASN